VSQDLYALLLIVAIGAGTYATRIGGHIVLSRFERLNPRVEAALDAVPAAVMSAIVAPLALATGPAETIAAGVAVATSLRFPIHVTLLAGMVTVALLRAAGL
jgi:uncharacterized membrane protein